jgi:hypothetical protein
VSQLRSLHPDDLPDERPVARDETVGPFRGRRVEPADGRREPAGRELVEDRRQRSTTRPAAPERVDDVHRGIPLVQRQVAQSAGTEGGADRLRRDPGSARQKQGERRAEVAPLVVEHGQLAHY